MRSQPARASCTPPPTCIPPHHPCPPPPRPAERHYTRSYGGFHTELEADPAFSQWFQQLEADAVDLATGPPWRGEGPFPVG